MAYIQPYGVSHIRRERWLNRNKLFNIDLMWVKPKSKLNQDDIAEAILICYSQVKPKKLGK